MDTHLLGQLALSYSPIIDRARSVMATRLTVFVLDPGASPDAADLLQAITQAWPADGAGLALSIRNEALLSAMLALPVPDHVMLEVPHFLAASAALAPRLHELAASHTLLLSGRPDHPMDPQVLACFKYAVVDPADERRGAEADLVGARRPLAFMHEGIATVAEMDQAFARGAVAVVGWPIDELVPRPAPRSASGAHSDLQVTVLLMNQVDNGEPIARLEATLKRDPTLAFKLLRYINSPLFGLRVEIGSFSHAVMMLGYQRLKRWLALLLATASKDPNLRAVMYAAVRRGLLMEALMPEADDDQRGELFICGVFSLLDRMFQQPFADLLGTVPVPEAVRLALVDGSGPYAPMLRLLAALEGGTGHAVLDAAEAAMLDMRAVNRALLHALAGAAQL
jgi:EAL and modified HD-GYP domain-containing signal transduction protein